VPVGYLVATSLLAWCTLLALRPLRRPRPLAALSFRLGLVLNELPFVAFYLLLASTLLAFGQGDIDSAGGWAVFGLALLTTLGLVLVVRRGLRAGPVVERALDDGLGAGWRAASEWPLGCAAVSPWPASCSRRSRSVAAMSSGRRTSATATRAGETCSTSTASAPIRRAAPRWSTCMGAVPKRQEEPRGASLIYRLASQGWVCVSANYRLRPAASFPDYLIDLKKVIAWMREHGHEYGADPAVMFVAGSSAGGHLAAMAALTPNDPAFQPGFEAANTSVTAAICLYGYYGSLHTEGRSPSSPEAYVGTHAPPFFVAHGDRDTVVFVEGARRFVERLGAPRPARSSTPSCPGRSTRSTCSIQSASRPSSMRSRPSQPG
jgi:acetyl esterase/lipase